MSRKVQGLHSKLVELMNKFSYVIDCEINMQKTVEFLHTYLQ